ncbi:MAG: alkaline phosphatase D family protein, partial [Rhizobiales bacterium]|nr:alkaline phosphatase D family protein [Hyphomicrobiales bacterium]
MRLKFTYPVDAGAFCTVGRRTLLKGLAGAAALTLAPSPFRHSLHAQPVFAVYPFSLGVASGDPSPDGFVIWTKIAPNPFVRGGGMANQPVEVAWAVASDERMAKVVQSGTATAFAELGHAVHVEVGGLEPGRDYHYRFTVGSERSRIGRAKTLPAAGSPVAEFRIGHAGCQRYEDGFFTAWRQIAAERFDLVFHYGDYIYEYRVLRPGDRPLAVVRTMPDAPDETYTLDDYRHRYAVYKSDPDLQDAHASAPFAVVFDDHEVANDWAGDVPRHVVPPEIFRLRRAD